MTLRPFAVLLLAAAAAAQEAPPRAIRFDEAVRVAAARNLVARIADEEMARADALVVEARSAWLPILTGQAAYTRLEGDRTVAGRLTAAADSFQAALSASVPLVSFRAWAQTRRAEDAAEVARAGGADVRRALALAVGRTYLSVIAAQRTVEVAETARRVAQAHVDYARARRSGGLGTELDQVRAEEELAADEAQLAQAQLGRSRAREALGLLVSGEGPLDAAAEPALGDAPPLAAGLDEAAAQRSDVVAARLRLDAAARARKDDWTDYAPILGLFGQVFVTAPQIDPTPRLGLQAQLTLTVPIYDGGLRTGLEREREINETEAREGLAATVRQARSDVRTAADEEARAEESLAAARRSAAASQRALELATTAYRAGAATSLEITDAERRARDAATQVVIAEDAVRQARLDLLAATGRFPAR